MGSILFETINLLHQKMQNKICIRRYAARIYKSIKKVHPYHDRLSGEFASGKKQILRNGGSTDLQLYALGSSVYPARNDFDKRNSNKRRSTVEAAINIPLRLARHFNRPSLRCRCTPGAQLVAMSIARTRLSKKAREHAKGEKRLSSQSLAFPARGTKIVSGPGSGTRHDHNPLSDPFLSGPPRSLMNCATCAKKKEKKKWVCILVQDYQRDTIQEF